MGCGSDPLGIGLQPLADYAVEGSLVDSLIDVADDLRQLHTEFGGRPYRVFLVWLEWRADEDRDGIRSDGEEWLDDLKVGVGSPTLAAEIELLPTPLASGLGGKRFDATGLTESGRISVSEVSIAYTEDVLSGLLPQFRDADHPETLRAGIEFFWELRGNRPAGWRTLGRCRTDLPEPRRRYHLAGTPSRSPYGFAWDPIDLSRADGERERDGSMPEV